MQEPTNRRIRVFISATFRDMMGGVRCVDDSRLARTAPVLPPGQVELVEVDLRWGIAEEQSTRKEILKLCLDEIRARRPFFIGLLGHRSGWVLEPKQIRDQTGRQVYATFSITEREIRHAGRNQPSDGFDRTSEIVFRMGRTTA
jgi:nephrocystin-3